MRKPASVALFALLAVLLVATAVLWQKYRTAANNNVRLQSSADAVQARYGEALNAIGEIQDSLATLGVGDATRPILPGSPAAERGLSLLRGREALDRIALLKAGLQRTRARLVELERRVHLGGVRVAGLEHVILNLKATLAEREATLAALSGRVDSLQSQVGSLSGQLSETRGTVQDQQQLIAHQRRELGTIYYVVGTRQSLMRQGLVVYAGGILGLGRTLQPAPSLRDSLFTPLDTDAESIIPIAAKRARLVSDQPAASYSILTVDGRLELHVLDPHAFRTVRHVVVVTD